MRPWKYISIKNLLRKRLRGEGGKKVPSEEYVLLYLLHFIILNVKLVIWVSVDLSASPHES